MNFSYLDIQRLRVFFKALKDGGFKSNLNQIPSSIRIDCFTLLRKLPQFQTEEFKDDNILISAVNKYLKDPNKRKDLLSEAEFTQQQRDELTEVLKEKPISDVTVSERPVGQVPSPIGEPAATMTGESIPNIPNLTSYSPTQPRIIRNIPHPPEIKPETPKINIANKSGVDTGEKTIPSPQKVNWSGFRMPTSITSGAKNLSSATQRFTGTNLGRMGRSLGGILKGTVGAGGPALGNLGLNSIKVGGDFISRLSSARASASRFSSTRLGAKGLGTGKKVALAFSLFGLFFGFTLISGIVDPNGTPTGQTAPIESIGSSDIKSCQFTRGGNNPKDASFTSNTLLGYIKEASSKSSIPPAVFAAFIRVESPSTSSMSDAQIANYAANCAQSPTGALGIMQIQPPGTTSAKGDPASCDDCIDAGARLVGKTVSTLTKEDYCDPRTNIIIGAGWILKKISKLGYGDGTKWDPIWTNDRKAIEALVNTYYGCFNYGGAQDCTGPFNYADDVWTSIQNCQPATNGGSGVISCPVNSPTITLGSKDTPGGHCSADYQKSYPCASPDVTGREKAIDLQSPDRTVFLPFLNGEKAIWTTDESGTAINEAEGGGFAFAATAQSKGKTYKIRFVHINLPTLKVGQGAESATPISTYITTANHAHVTLQEDGIFKPADLYFNLCK